LIRKAATQPVAVRHRKPTKNDELVECQRRRQLILAPKKPASRDATGSGWLKRMKWPDSSVTMLALGMSSEARRAKEERGSQHVGELEGVAHANRRTRVMTHYMPFLDFVVHANLIDLIG
jgi:hypothetical protein